MKLLAFCLLLMTFIWILFYRSFGRYAVGDKTVFEQMTFSERLRVRRWVFLTSGCLTAGSMVLLLVIVFALSKELAAFKYLLS